VFSGAVGAGVGTVLLIRLSDAPLLMGLSSLIFLFLLFRLQKPKWQISGNATKLLVIP